MQGIKPDRQYPFTEKVVRARRRRERIDRVVDIVQVILAILWIACLMYGGTLVGMALVKYLQAP